MSIKKTALGAAFLLSTMGSTALVAPAIADDHEEMGNLTRTISFTVNHNHMSQFSAGIQAYFACYNENGGTESWGAYTPYTGKQTTVGFRSSGKTWADLDADDPADDACESVYTEQVMPHYKYRTRGLETSWADASNWGDESGVAMVISFDVKDMAKTREMAEMMHAGSEAAGMSGYGWSVYMSGDKWDVSYVMLRGDFAGMAPPEDGFWDMQKKHHGEEKGAKLRADWMANVNDVAVDYWTRHEGMSNYQSSD